jgi:hypothetical protein
MIVAHTRNPRLPLGRSLGYAFGVLAGVSAQGTYLGGASGKALVSYAAITPFVPGVHRAGRRHSPFSRSAWVDVGCAANAAPMAKIAAVVTITFPRYMTASPSQATCRGLTPRPSASVTLGGLTPGQSSSATFGGLTPGQSSSATFGGLTPGQSISAIAALDTAQQATKAIKLVFIVNCSVLCVDVRRDQAAENRPSAN